eukprot:CAMPEP_0119134414 /NCGR_PEP_ID=MMETSP1310-20130426/16817_1 /TAXON_ID=464262 /ORGANISM="Genus nov. species nov., Strain RCC2339" /LENGTH=144 /DNA_ID=CAMNT_0007125205 /DNA_START=108 /DNA_END=539 /DNA_ORIENTATION=+
MIRLVLLGLVLAVLARSDDVVYFLNAPAEADKPATYLKPRTDGTYYMVHAHVRGSDNKCCVMAGQNGNYAVDVGGPVQGYDLTLHVTNFNQYETSNMECFTRPTESPRCSIMIDATNYDPNVYTCHGGVTKENTTCTRGSDISW